MLFSKSSSSAGVVVLAAIISLFSSLASASPTPVDLHVTKNPQHDLIFVEALELAHQPHLEKRLEADFSLEKSWNNELLFAGSWINSDAGLGVTDSVSLSVLCKECYTKGTVSAKLAEDLIDPTVRLDFHGVEAYVDIDVDISAGAAYALNLFTSQSPLGLGFPGISVGLVFYVDLVFALTAEVDLSGGFYVAVEEGSYLETSILGGDVTDSLFDGLKSKSLPVTVRKGKATFKADLRLRVQCGAELGLDGMGLSATAEVGIYANLIEYVAVLESTPTCALQATQWWDLNVGAFARFGVVIDYKTFGVVPTVSTTLLSAPTMTTCWGEIAPPPTGGAGGGSDGDGAVITATTAPAGLLSSSGVAVSPAAVGSGISYGYPGSYFESGGSGGAVETGAPSSSVADPIITSSPTASVPSSVPIYPAGNSSTYPIYSTGGAISASSVSAPNNGGSYSTATYILTSCAVAVPNCPTSLQHQVTVTKTVEVYPTDPAVPTPDAKPTTSTGTCTSEAAAASPTIINITKDVIILQPCPTPITSTFTYTPPGATAAPPTSTYPAIPTNAYLFPNGSSITTILGFSTLAPSEIITVTSTGSYVPPSESVPVPTEYPVLQPSTSVPLASTSVVTAGANGLMRGTGGGLGMLSVVIGFVGVWLW
ncbi:hypothetical protein QBC37DRAFT_148326 [Rhypophila decipiens]|uniref:Uncharacterized protein n=1 Tax=Rhypophila decipiens TaxID=261697 RepID=A0AAN6Y995_9PEZI|nr:hypothetical protein QBC37DRAFT_148326 [Rhypophila decipiens]